MDGLGAGCAAEAWLPAAEKGSNDMRSCSSNLQPFIVHGGSEAR